MPTVSDKLGQMVRQVRRLYQKTYLKEGIRYLDINNKTIKWQIPFGPLGVFECALFSVPTACEMLNIKRERVTDWIKREFILPAIPTEKSGDLVILTANNVMTIGIFSELVKNGFTRELASKLISFGIYGSWTFNMDLGYSSNTGIAGIGGSVCIPYLSMARNIINFAIDSGNYYLSEGTGNHPKRLRMGNCPDNQV